RERRAAPRRRRGRAGGAPGTPRRAWRAADAGVHGAAGMNAQLEVRQAAPGGTLTLSGYAATWTPYAVEDRAGSYVETITRGAFRSTLAGKPDVTLAAGHGGGVIARTTSGTLQLHEDGKGLHFLAQLDPSDIDVQKAVPKIQRGDLTEMSFS